MTYESTGTAPPLPPPPPPALVEMMDLSDVLIDPAAATLIPEHLARRYAVVPVSIGADGTLTVAMADPGNVVALDDLRSITGRTIVRVAADREQVLAAINRFLRDDDELETLAGELTGLDDENSQLGATSAVVDDAPIVRFVNALITQAVQDRASDIHIEPQERDVRIRYRVDGVLHEVTTQSRRIVAGVVSRLKIMADLDIAERRIPQDGRLSLRAAGRVIDLRLSTLPTVFGEKVVMRILDKSSVLMELSDLGFLPDNYARFERSFRKPYGMILVTGPTGSGKSTTLYATLNVINNPGVNIVTVEDPVEYRLPGINQVQVNPKAGLVFSKALRSILRQDPDIVLIGEMRDHETAQIGMEAALTGHLVLSTLHTNDAPSAVTRLSEMGIEAFLVASAVDVVLAQRLARRLCARCKEPFHPTPSDMLTAGLPFEGDIPQLYRPGGCAHCANTGYRGRLALHEVMVVSEEIERLIVMRAPTEEISKYAISQGMRTLRDDGLAKVMLGETTIEEVARVVA